MKIPYAFKKCNKCGKILLATTDNFHRGKNGKYGLNPECKECRAKYLKEHYEQHREKLITYQKEFNEKYYRGIQGKLIIFNNNSRRRFKDNYIHDITIEQYNDMMNFFNNRCAYTELEFDNNFSFEHIDCYSLDGVHAIWNILPCISSLNKSKQDMDFLTWYKEQDFYSEERLAKIYEWIEYSKNKYEGVTECSV